MGPEKWKGELPADEAAESERAARRDEREPARRREASDPREDEGYDQPQSSAQKWPLHPARPEDEELGE